MRQHRLHPNREARWHNAQVRELAACYHVPLHVLKFWPHNTVKKCHDSYFDKHLAFVQGAFWIDLITEYKGQCVEKSNGNDE